MTMPADDDDAPEYLGTYPSLDEDRRYRYYRKPRTSQIFRERL
jgi:hypothetical protein